IAAVIRPAEARFSASTITITSIRLSLVGWQVDCSTNTSLPRTFSRSSTITSPSEKRDTVARPRWILRWRTTSLARRGLAFPLNTIRLSMDTRVSGDWAGPTQQQKQPPPAAVRLNGWGGRDRTYECRNQNPMPYHLATPQWTTIRRSSRPADACRDPAPQNPASFQATGAARRAPRFPFRTM